MHHSFNVALAQRLGLVQAILLENIYFWVSKNELNEKNIFDGRGWTYNSVRAFSEQFPYLTEKQVRVALEKMEQDGIILSGNYNKSKYDRTKWYSITDDWRKQLTELGYRFAYSGNLKCPNGKIDLPKWANGNSQKGEPIPYPNTYPNTNSIGLRPIEGKPSEHAEPEVVEKSVEKSEHGNSQINELMAYWEEKCGFPIKTKVQMNRFTCQRLLKSRGPDKIKSAIDVLPATFDDRYAPVIKNFKDLEDKWDSLRIYCQRRSARFKTQTIVDEGGMEYTVDSSGNITGIKV